MSDFVEQCRAEWTRLGVAEPVAEEMAADLASDLAEGEAEGVSAADLIGPAFSDPSSFAASWAAERGVVPEQVPQRTRRKRPRFLVAFTALAAVMLVISGLLLATGEPKVSLVKTRSQPGASAVHLQHVVASASAATPVEWILLFLASVALGFAAWLWTTLGRSRPPVAPA